jgi:hypothetical protein
VWIATLKLTGMVFDIRPGLRYTFTGPRATHVSLAGVYMAWTGRIRGQVFLVSSEDAP